jgi:hypothetical protein
MWLNYKLGPPTLLPSEKKFWKRLRKYFTRETEQDEISRSQVAACPRIAWRRPEEGDIIPGKKAFVFNA